MIISQFNPAMAGADSGGTKRARVILPDPDPITGLSSPQKKTGGGSPVKLQKRIKPTVSRFSPRGRGGYDGSGIFPKNAQKFGDTVVDIVDRVTDFPNKVHDLGDRITDEIINVTDSIKGRATEKATENLTESKIKSMFGDLGAWVMSGKNKFYVIGAVIVIFFFIRK